MKVIGHMCVTGIVSLLDFGAVLIVVCFVFPFTTYIVVWPCPGNMPKYYPGLRDILSDSKQEGNMSLKPG